MHRYIANLNTVATAGGKVYSNIASTTKKVKETIANVTESYKSMVV